MTKTVSIILCLLMIVSIVPIIGLTASAEKSGYYTYSVSNGEATITDCDTSISGNITIPSELGIYPVTSIGDEAFHNCTSLTRVTIPDSVKSIGYNAFWHCTSLTRVTIPDSIIRIDEGAFAGCSSLTSVTIPDSIIRIDEGTFAGCSSLTSVTIPDSVKSIGAYAFSFCTSLKSITIPNSVKSIGDEAFYNCTSLNRVNITDVAKWCKIWFGDCVVSNPLYYAKNLYLNNKLVTNLIIPNSVTSICDYAFYNCTSLKTVIIGKKVKTIGERAFMNCKSITSITIPNSVSSIGYEAFYNCTSLKSITIPNSVSSIGKEAFGYDFRRGNTYKIPNFIIIGKKSTEAEKYATRNHFKFQKLCSTHSYTKRTLQKATCFSKGIALYKCKNCGNYYIKTIAKLTLKTPKATIKSGKKYIKVSYTKVSGATGFQVKYVIGSKSVTNTFKTSKSTAKTINKLKKGNYKVYVRAYAQKGTEKAYSSWTKAKSVKVK